MNRINKLFLDRQKPVLSIYFFCAGTPDPEATVDVVRTLELRGVDMVEIGIPFSDPLADGPVIQGASTQPLRQGMTLSRLMGQLAGLRPAGVSIPVVLMGYLNPVLQYGFERFCRECKACGVDGVIIPTCPLTSTCVTSARQPNGMTSNSSCSSRLRPAKCVSVRLMPIRTASCTWCRPPP